VNPVLSLCRLVLPVSFVTFVIGAVVLDVVGEFHERFAAAIVHCTGRMQWTKEAIEFVLTSLFSIFVFSVNPRTSLSSQSMFHW
jgi:hypothetical protein